MIEFYVAYIALCIFIVVQYCKKDNLFTLKDYLNFKKNVTIMILVFILIFVTFFIK